MWQEITVYIILAVTVALVARRIWMRITCKPEPGNSKCDTCHGCPLKKDNKNTG